MLLKFSILPIPASLQPLIRDGPLIRAFVQSWSDDTEGNEPAAVWWKIHLKALQRGIRLSHQKSTHQIHKSYKVCYIRKLFSVLESHTANTLCLAVWGPEPLSKVRASYSLQPLYLWNRYITQSGPTGCPPCYKAYLQLLLHCSKLCSCETHLKVLRRFPHLPFDYVWLLLLWSASQSRLCGKEPNAMLNLKVSHTSLLFLSLQTEVLCRIVLVCS